jgi:hypothetical protein
MVFNSICIFRDNFNIMKVSIGIKLIIAVACTALFSPFSFAAPAKLDTRNINIAGLVYNAETLAPVEQAAIYDTESHLLGTTDKNGYFKVTITYNKPGEMYFKLRIKKTGFSGYIQNEHWGNLANNSNAIMYLGLNPSGYKGKGLSAIPESLKNSDLSYDNVLRSFETVKQKQAFNNQIEAAKAGNQNIFVQVSDAYYIVDNTGWIKLTSAADLVSIDNKQPLAANKLNHVLERKSIKWMTPLEGKDAKFGVYTR